MNFGLSYGPKDFKIPNCAVCGKEVKANEKVLVERRTLHVGCFRCAICAVPLEFGECAMDDHLSRYGPTWFCLNHQSVMISEKLRPFSIKVHPKNFHSLLPPKQKEALLERSGYKFREGTGKAKK